MWASVSSSVSGKSSSIFDGGVGVSEVLDIEGHSRPSPEDSLVDRYM